MATIRKTTRRVEEKIANVGAPRQENQAPLQEKVPVGGQVSVNPPVMSDGEIKGDQDVTTHVQAMTAQEN